jgi:hypothetical protein
MPELKALKRRRLEGRRTSRRQRSFILLFGRTAYRFKGEGRDARLHCRRRLQFPIFEVLAFANIQDAKAKLMRSQAEMETARVEIAAEVKQLKLDLDLAEENIQITEKTRESAERSFLLARERYRLERASELEIAEAEAIYSSSKRHTCRLSTIIISRPRARAPIGGTDEVDK